MPRADAACSPADWPLSAEGRREAAAIGHQVPSRALLLSSAERKAIETITAATGRAPLIDDRFGEVLRPGEPFDDRVRERRGAWVEGATDSRHAGWETGEDAFRRFDEAVGFHTATDLVIATHGMVMVAWLVGIGEVAPGSAARTFWSDLPFPAVVTVTRYDRCAS